MREVSEDEVMEMAGESDCPVLSKEESEEMEVAVCLKQFPQGYVLGISDKLEDLKLLFTPSREEADKWYQHYRARLRKFGTPFGGPTRCQEEEPLMQDCKLARAFDPST